MARVIKFRAWDGRYMHLPGLSDHWLSPTGDVYEDATKKYDTPHTEIERSKATVMLWTGLLDTNGKEIYEGDVVVNNNINWTVDFYDGSFVIREIGKETNKWHIIGEDTHCEVIGNIYENPELITN